jgi:DNA-binding transcriptional MerR regulator
VTSSSGPELLTSGEFAHQARLSRKALRIYDENGLLRPAGTDPAGQRRYTRDQVRLGRLIGMLRGADLGLAQIGRLLADLPGGLEPAVRRLDDHLAGLEMQHTGRRMLIRHIHAILREEEAPMFAVQTRHVPAQRVMSMQRRLRAPQTDDFVREVKTAFAKHLNGATAPGPLMLIFHGIVDHESDGPLEVVLGCGDDVTATDLIGIRTEPAHDEAYTTITKAQWAFPAILVAYDAVTCSPEATARPRSRLSCREVYLTEPAEIGDDDLVCDVAFPLG